MNTRRLAVMTIITLAVFAALMGRAFQLQIVDGDQHHAESSKRARAAASKAADRPRAGDNP